LRTREEILEENWTKPEYKMIELLLDIREILQKSKPKRKYTRRNADQKRS